MGGAEAARGKGAAALVAVAGGSGRRGAWTAVAGATSGVVSNSGAALWLEFGHAGGELGRGGRVPVDSKGEHCVEVRAPPKGLVRPSRSWTRRWVSASGFSPPGPRLWTPAVFSRRWPKAREPGKRISLRAKGFAVLFSALRLGTPLDWEASLGVAWSEGSGDSYG